MRSYNGQHTYWVYHVLGEYMLLNDQIKPINNKCGMKLNSSHLALSWQDMVQLAIL